MNWLSKLMPSRIRTETNGPRRGVKEGVWEKCEGCGTALYLPELERNLHVCPKCQHHRPIRARMRLEAFLDAGTGVEIAAGLEPDDPLRFRDGKKYKDRLVAAQKNVGEKDALVAMRGLLHGRPLAVCAFEFAFMGGNDSDLGNERPDPGGPTLRLRVISIMGGTDVKRGRKLTRAERKAKKHLEHGR